MRIILSFLFAAGLFLMPPAQAASLTVCNPAGQSEDGVYVDTILASSSGTAVDFPRADTETIEAAGDGLEAFNALFLARGWGDGLPLVPPTPERVKAMLAGYDLPDDFPIATLPPLDGVATVGKIAVNAVMAGCEPRHMPLLVAAVEAVSQPEFDLRGVATTTNPDSVLVIVSGPIVKRLGINAGTNTFGRGNRANACIGRALHLIINNVGGSRPGITDMSTLGQPGDFAMFLAENADASPWPPFHTEYGFLRTTLAGDTLDNSNGIVWDLAWLYRYTNGGLTLTPGIGVEWNSENQNDYYYGVSRKESARSGMRGYNPDDSWNPYLELSANYNFLGDWSVYGVARYTRLSDEITDSPMVDKSWTGLISTGITYKF